MGSIPTPGTAMSPPSWLVHGALAGGLLDLCEAGANRVLTEDEVGDALGGFLGHVHRNVLIQVDRRHDARVAQPVGQHLDLADEALGVGRNQLVRRRLSEVRRRVGGGEVGLLQAADEIVGVVLEFGLRPEVKAAEPAAPLAPEDLGVVVFQVVLTK